MTQIINVCHGWGCPAMTVCARSDFNLPGDRIQSGWTRHYQEPHVGENCPNFRPLGTDAPWGDGSDLGVR